MQNKGFINYESTNLNLLFEYKPNKCSKYLIKEYIQNCPIISNSAYKQPTSYMNRYEH